MRSLFGMGLLSGAVLLLQVALTRVFSIAQFYHFAFLVVSLALLGFGASGSLLSIWPRLKSQKLYTWYALGFALVTLLAYLFINHQPFDSYSIAWDRSQTNLLIANLLGLTLPFVFAGLLIGAMLSDAVERAGQIYAANLLGSAAGAVSAPVALAVLGSERTILLCAVFGTSAAFVLTDQYDKQMIMGGMVAGCVALFVVFPSQFEVRSSQYKRISHFQRNPDAEIVATTQNAYSRVDLIQSSTIHSAPGLSLTYFGDLPSQHGLLIDGDSMLTLSKAEQISEKLLQALPISIPYSIRPDANVLILGTGGGLEIHAGLINNANQVVAIEPNALIYDVLTDDLRDWVGIADIPQVTLLHEEIRSFVQKTDDQYDLIQLTLTDNYRPISSGAFTLTEDFTLTIEAFRGYLDRAGSDGLLVLNRWLQSPPSESLRILALIIEALRSENPSTQIVVFRSFQMATFIVKPTPFTLDELTTLLEAIEQMRFDLVLAPEMPAEMINRYAVLEEPIYHATFLELISTDDREAFYADYPFEITPPTDNQPFFFHFFRWEQTPDVIENLGRRWQPFGGSGYFVLLALLAFAIAAALIFILLPVGVRPRFRAAINNVGIRHSTRALAYFTIIGLAFLLVEISLIQQYILVLARPTWALATVIGALLFFSGLGSALSSHFRIRQAIFGLGVLLILYPVFVDLFTPTLLSLPLLMRMIAVALLIAPVGFLMGMPFPKGLSALQETPDLVPWAWAVNGSASVVTAVLAIILALWLGFALVLLIGAALYFLAGILVLHTQ